jgi:ankyrin repeat protein
MSVTMSDLNRLKTMRKWIDAVPSGDVAGMRDAIAEGMLVDEWDAPIFNSPSTGRARMTALHLYCELRNTAAVQMLLDARAGPDTLTFGAADGHKYADDQSALGVAAGHGDSDILQLLLAAGADVQGGGASTTPLYLACESGNATIVTMLLEAGAAVDVSSGENWKTEDGWSPLFAACQGFSTSDDADFLGCVRQLVRSGAAIERRSNTDGWTPLLLAANFGNLDIVQELILCGARRVLKNSGLDVLRISAVNRATHVTQ